MKEKGLKIGIIIGVILIFSTASLMALPFENAEKEQNPLNTALDKMKSSEKRVLDFIDQEKAELSSKMKDFSYP